MCFARTLLVAIGLVATARAQATSPSDFMFQAVITGETTPGLPMRVSLGQGVLSATQRDFADLRVFDDLGRETPYVIYEQTEAPKRTSTFAFEIVSYDTSGESEEIVLKQPASAKPFHEIEFVIAGRDFKKSVEVFAGQSTGALQQVGAETIFDFSSRVDLRRTTVDVKETDAPYLRIVLSDETPDERGGSEIELRYEGLEFWTAGEKPGPFRVERILGHTGERKSASHAYDVAHHASPPTRLDDDGNTIIDLAGNLPVAFVRLEVENPYYRRRVQMLAGDIGQEGEYHSVGEGVIYKVPGMNESEDTIWFRRPQGNYRLRIINEDNPPLDVRSVETGWVRRNLYFVHEEGRHYSLHAGSDNHDVASPRYDLGSLIPADHAKLKQYASLSIGDLQTNPNYAPTMDRSTRDRLERTALTVVVIAVVCLMAFWVARLLKGTAPPARD